jgi:hypothetical protein
VFIFLDFFRTDGATRVPRWGNGRHSLRGGWGQFAPISSPFINPPSRQTVPPLSFPLRRRVRQPGQAKNSAVEAGPVPKEKVAEIREFPGFNHFIEEIALQISGRRNCAKTASSCTKSRGPGLSGTRYGREFNPAQGDEIRAGS